MKNKTKFKQTEIEGSQPKTLGKDGVRDGVKLTENQREILKKIKENPYITAENLSKEIGINKRNIEKNLSNLQNKRLIRRVGSAKGGSWEVL